MPLCIIDDHSLFSPPIGPLGPGRADPSYCQATAHHLNVFANPFAGIAGGGLAFAVNGRGGLEHIRCSGSEGNKQ